MQQHDHIDVGGDGLSFRSTALERRTPYERAVPIQYLFDPLFVSAEDDEIANGDIGTDVSNAHWRPIERDQHTAPATVQTADATGGQRCAEVTPMRQRLGCPAEANVTWVVDTVNGSVSDE